MIEARSKRMSLIGLGILTAIAGVLAVGAAGMNGYHRYFGAHREVPTILILSKDLVRSGIEANMTADEQKAAKDKIFADSILKTGVRVADGKAVTSTAKETDPAKLPNPNEPTHEDRNAQLTLLLSSMEDGIGISTSDALKHSNLFKPIAGGVVAGQLAQLHAAQDSAADGTSKMSGLVKNKGDEAHKIAASEKLQKTDSSINVIAKNVGAEYILTIEVVEPNFTAKLLAPDKMSDKYHFELTAKPVVHVEVFSVDGKGFSGAKELVLPSPIRREIYLTAPIIKLNLDSDVSNVSEDIQLEIHKKVGQAVAEWLTNEIAPAHVVQAENQQYTIDRGSSDGVRQGAVYTVMREIGDDLNGSGVDGATRDLGKNRVQVGTVTIASVDTLKSVAAPLSGGPFRAGDLVVKLSEGADGSSGTDVPLGTSELAQSGRPRPARVRLAVDDIAVNINAASGQSTQLVQMISDALARDPRVEVIPRAQMQEVLDERNLNAQSVDDGQSGGMQGMATSNYLVSGSFSSQSSQHVTNRSISVAGVSEPLSRSTSVSTAVSGTLRVVSASGVLKFSTSVSGGTLQSAAEAAARALLIQLFPMQVIQINGSTVVLDRGQDAGLKVGARLALFHVGKPIVDNQTGAVHEGLRVPAGDVVIQTVQPTISMAMTQGNTTAQNGDIVLATGERGSGAAPSDAQATPVSHPVAHRAASARAAKPENEGLHF